MEDLLEFIASDCKLLWVISEANKFGSTHVREGKYIQNSGRKSTRKGTTRKTYA
jgi:hypothetical protein